MNLTFLGQGYEPISENAVGRHLIKLLADTAFCSFTAISAFTSLGGINGLSKHIEAAKKHLDSITIVTGIDQKVTSKEALETLLSLDVSAYVFYQPSKTIFHPKIYLFEGAEKSALIIGSSNLTSRGLFTNVESSILISIDNTQEADKEIIRQLKHYFKGVFDFTDPNLKKLSKEIITYLVKVNIVPSEAERKAEQDKIEKSKSEEHEKIISKIFPKRPTSGIPREFRNSTKPKATGKELAFPDDKKVEETISDKRLVWTSGPLTQRDLNIPQGSNTNPTGSMLLKKGKTVGIDQRYYFRDVVFSALSWESDQKTTYLERAKASFKIIIDGKNHGEFELIITHNSRTDTRSYQQKNSMTSISWGATKKIIAKEALIGKNANLYKNEGDGTFTLEIK